MDEEILLEKQSEKRDTEEGRGWLSYLEEKINDLLTKFQELKKERDDLTIELDGEREKRMKLEKKVELISQDREKVRVRIDQLLHHLKNIDI
jgi:seryl-tRNA synthetase